MDTTKKIIKSITWIMGLPVFGMTIYNLYRQEIDPSALPLINILPDWHWAIWLSLFLFILVVRLMIELYLRPSDESNSKPQSLVAQTSGRDSYASGRDTIINPPAEKIPPNIYAGVLSREDHSLIERSVFYLRSLPPRPNFDELVKMEQERIVQKYHNPQQNLQGLEKQFQDIMNTARQIAGQNSNWPEDVKEYLTKYREYKEKEYNCSIINDRYRMLDVVLQCRGISPASLVILELYFPEQVHFPNYEIEWLYDEMQHRKDFGMGFKPQRPTEPDPFTPSSFLRTTMVTPMDYFANMEPIAQKKGDFKVSKRNGVNVVTYEVNDLIQNHLYTDLVPIPIWLDNFDRSTVIDIPIKIYSRDLITSPTEKILEVELVIKQNE